MPMRKKELINQLAQEEKLSERKAQILVEAVFDIITQKLVKGEKVKISGFGTFLVNKRKGRTIRNPKTNKRMEISDFWIPHFRAGEPLKEKVREGMRTKEESKK